MDENRAEDGEECQNVVEKWEEFSSGISTSIAPVVVLKAIPTEISDWANDVPLKSLPANTNDEVSTFARSLPLRFVAHDSRTLTCRTLLATEVVVIGLHSSPVAVVDWNAEKLASGRAE